MKKNRTKTPVALYAAALIFCLVLITSSFYNSGFLARYTSASQGSDGARVAKYDVTISDLSSSSLSMNSFDDGTLAASTQFTVSSNSEVDVRYSVVVTFPRALPSWVHIAIDGVEPSVNGATYTFNDLGSFDTGEGNSATHTLSFTVDPGLQNEDLSLNGISIDVIVEQID